jgi:putative tricarboxylic transport membrane protein
VLAGIILWHIQGFPAMPGQKFGPAWFPGLVAAGLALCGALLIATGLRARAPWAEVPQWLHSPRARRGVAALLGGLLLYVLAADALGFHITGLVLLAVWMRVLGASWRLTLPVALVATLAIHFSFYRLLKVPLPWGLLEAFAF